MAVTISLQAPLFTAWPEQFVRLRLPGTEVGTPLRLTVDGAETPFQYTGAGGPGGAEVMLWLGFAEGEEKELIFESAAEATTCLERRALELQEGATLGVPGRELLVPPPEATEDGVRGPFAGYAGQPMASRLCCDEDFAGAELALVNDGPLFVEYELVYRFGEDRHYTLRLRCFREAPYLTVHERYYLGLGGEMVWTINPERRYDTIVSHGVFDFQGAHQPTVKPLGEEHPRDVLCRLQMPPLGAYPIPNNRYFFAFRDSRDESRPMIGVMGLHGAAWVAPVEGMPEIFDREGRVEWHAGLESGARHWLLYAGPVETDYAEDRRFVFHALQADWNALRLDEHLDLTGTELWDARRWGEDAFFVGEDYRGEARSRCERLASLRRLHEGATENPEKWSHHQLTFETLLDPTPEKQQRMLELLLQRFRRWVRQFQGWRIEGDSDYQKSVIGFARWLRGMMIAYELLRKDGALDEEQLRVLHAYFAFAARRITDEGRWPHSRTMLHPDHPLSVRDLYTYGGEHRPDKLYWTNSLPNFQSDPLCALAHLSALLPEHPDAAAWRRYALEDLERQLNAYCGESGAWEESINYALYTFSYFVITFRVLKRRLGIDYCNDERVRRFAGWLTRFFGPYDKRFEAWTWPGVGNSTVPQRGGLYLLAYAGELPEDDPLREACLAIYQKQEGLLVPQEHYPTVVAAMAPVPEREYPLPACGSEAMDEVGVAMRHAHLSERESYLFQKIGFAKDHYENDETAFNWYAKGTPLCMDYGTYTGDVSPARVHNLVEIPDMDSIRRGYLADHLFSPALDYTHCEQPVSLKLLWGKVRSFEEIEAADGKVDRLKTPYFYIGDANPVGPKTWKTRRLLFVKPDYVLLFDQVYGEVPHRYNLHVTGEAPRRDGPLVEVPGRFDLDLLCYVQYPRDFAFETGTVVPNYDRDGNPETKFKHAQDYFRLYNQADGVYRTLLFAREKGAEVTIAPAGRAGLAVSTPAWTDYVFLANEELVEQSEEVSFTGRGGWIRRTADGQVQAAMLDGDRLRAFGLEFAGRGPWLYNLDGDGEMELRGPTPRPVTVREA